MAQKPPWGLRWRSSTLFVVITVGIGLFTDLFLFGLVVPILPFILEDRTHVPEDQIQRHVSGLLAAYAGASVLFSPVAGYIADKLPTRQLPFLTGLVALLLATLLLLVGQNVPTLVIARLLQGVSAAVVWTIGLALTLDTVGPENLGKTIGSIFGFISIGELAAPVLGGVVYSKSGDKGVFALGFGILALDFILRLLLIEKKVAAKYGHGDLDTNRNPSDEQDGEAEEQDGTTEEDPLIKKQEEDQYQIKSEPPRFVKALPILYCLSNPRLLTALLIAFAQATIIATFDATVPTVAGKFFGFNSLKAGLLFIPLVLPYLILGPFGGWAVDRFGPKPSAVFGFGYLVPVSILLRLVRPGGAAQIRIYCGLLALCGLGLAAIGAPSVVEAAFVVQQYDKANPDFFGANGPYASLYGLNSMFFSAGLTVGPLVSGALKEAVGYGNMNLFVAALSLVIALLSFVYVGGKPGLLGKR